MPARVITQMTGPAAVRGSVVTGRPLNRAIVRRHLFALGFAQRNQGERNGRGHCSDRYQPMPTAESPRLRHSTPPNFGRSYETPRRRQIAIAARLSSRAAETARDLTVEAMIALLTLCDRAPAVSSFTSLRMTALCCERKWSLRDSNP